MSKSKQQTLRQSYSSASFKYCGRNQKRGRSIFLGQETINQILNQLQTYFRKQELKVLHIQHRMKRSCQIQWFKKPKG
jgi:hypothetical protein